MSLQSHRRESIILCGADRVALAREDAGSASNTMPPMDFVPFLHNLYYMDFRVESSHKLLVFDVQLGFCLEILAQHPVQRVRITNKNEAVTSCRNIFSCWKHVFHNEIVHCRLHHIHSNLSTYPLQLPFKRSQEPHCWVSSILTDAIMLIRSDITYGTRWSNCWLPASIWVKINQIKPHCRFPCH